MTCKASLIRMFVIVWGCVTIMAWFGRPLVAQEKLGRFRATVRGVELAEPEEGHLAKIKQQRIESRRKEVAHHRSAGHRRSRPKCETETWPVHHQANCRGHRQRKLRGSVALLDLDLGALLNVEHATGSSFYTGAQSAEPNPTWGVGDAVVPNAFQSDVSFHDHWRVRMSAFGGTDFDGVSTGGMGLLLQAPGAIGFDTSVMTLRESGGPMRDHLWLGDANLVYECVVTQTLRSRVGIGVNWLGDSIGAEVGLNLTAGLDWQPVAQWTVAGEIDLGSLGQADLFHGQLSVGRQLSSSTQWVVGYDHIDIGGITIGSAFTGLRFRF